MAKVTCSFCGRDKGGVDLMISGIEDRLIKDNFIKDVRSVGEGVFDTFMYKIIFFFF